MVQGHPPSVADLADGYLVCMSPSTDQEDLVNLGCQGFHTQALSLQVVCKLPGQIGIDL